MTYQEPIRPGLLLIVTSFAFIAVANVLRYEKAVPVFVDIEADTLNLDASRIEAAITSRTKAILVVHTFGCPAEMSVILDIAHRHHLYVLEDACEAIGAEYQGRKVGSLGDAGVFGSYPNKQITTGEGEWLSPGTRSWRRGFARSVIKAAPVPTIGSSIPSLDITTGYPRSIALSESAS